MLWGERGGLARSGTEKDGWAYSHTDRAIYPEIKLRAKHMRENPTVAEDILWQRLR